MVAFQFAALSISLLMVGLFVEARSFKKCAAGRAPQKFVASLGFYAKLFADFLKSDCVHKNANPDAFCIALTQNFLRPCRNPELWRYKLVDMVVKSFFRPPGFSISVQRKAERS